jgi:hypothetical protein
LNKKNGAAIKPRQLIEITGMSIHNAIADRNNQNLSATHYQALGALQGDGELARVTVSASTDELRSGQDVLPATRGGAS